MIFGNWEVTENGIIGRNKMSRYEILKQDLELLISDEYVDKLVNITEKDNVEAEDVFSLNLAYMYSLGKFDIRTITNQHMYNTKQKQLLIRPTT
jgi:hypothetical protein